MAILFHERVRTLLQARRLSIADLAEATELAPSLISKLLTDTADVRREPRIEHVLAIARALEASPTDLTDADSLLVEWVPRSELEAETAARARAQGEAAKLRTELAGAVAEINALKATVERLGDSLTAQNRAHAELELRFRLEKERLRATTESAEARLSAALDERDRALTDADHYYRGWANAYSHYQLLERQVAQDQAAAGLKTLIAAIGGAFVGAAAVESTSLSPSGRTTRTKPRRS